jgi:hypothetical protein
MFPAWYPAADYECFMIPPSRSWPRDRDSRFWQLEDDHLGHAFNRRVLKEIEDQHVQHISVFALAPQPLLIRLGSLLTDITPVQVYPRVREPEPAWGWRSHPRNAGFIVLHPQEIKGPPALVLAMSDHVPDERVKAVLGQGATIWRVTLSRPHNDFVRSRRQLQDFRALARQLLVDIGKAHGQQALLHVFPAAPAAIAVELGRVRQPKVQMPWQVWDAVAGSGFVPAIEIRS